MRTSAQMHRVMRIHATQEGTGRAQKKPAADHTCTHPLASVSLSSSGAMYSGVPRGGVDTLAQPLPLGSGIARSARPKSLILADTDTAPSVSTDDTHSTCDVTTHTSTHARSGAT